jgi:TatA/E family protein of Tat protein translocase
MELGSGEILLILIVALLIYGGRLPEVARAIGKSVGELKRGLTETKDVVAKELDAGLHVDLDEPKREVQRAMTEALAKEDISSPPTGGAERHENPN